MCFRERDITEYVTLSVKLITLVCAGYIRGGKIFQHTALE